MRCRHYDDCKFDCEYCVRARRERIATAALQGFLSQCEPGSEMAHDSPKEAVKVADKLIAELDKPRGKP